MQDVYSSVISLMKCFGKYEWRQSESRTAAEIKLIKVRSGPKAPFTPPPNAPLPNFPLPKPRFRRCTVCARGVHAFHPPYFGGLFRA